MGEIDAKNQSVQSVEWGSDMRHLGLYTSIEQHPRPPSHRWSELILTLPEIIDTETQFSSFVILTFSRDDQNWRHRG